MTKEQAIHDLIVIKEFFEKESGATPMCIEYAIEALEKGQIEKEVKRWS